MTAKIGRSLKQQRDFDCARVRAYRNSNLEKCRELNKQWRLRNPARMAAYKRKWKKNNKDAVRLSQRRSCELREAKVSDLADLVKLLRVVVETKTLKIERLQRANKRLKQNHKTGNARR